MRAGSIFYFFREAFKSLSRNKLLSFATISTISVCILIIGIAVLITLNTGNFITQLESDVEIVAYMDKDLTSESVTDIGEQIKEIQGVKAINFVPRDDALKKLQKNIGGKEYDLKATLGKNPLPDTYEIKASNPHDVASIAGEVGKISGVYKVNYGKGFVEKLFNATRWIRIISLVFIALLVLGAIFLIATTIRLAIFARRKEIYLMKLIGSTDWFIRWPFIIEGILLGVLGAVVSIAILLAAYSSLLNSIETMSFLPLITSSSILRNFYLSLLAAGGVLGVLGTFISINRFLDV
ncbi:MAG: permease-like cell division protein FtsX [Syntrophomonadaceae bacterium]|nr:permease-like cell division protein FtsX [Syntrophomonadaceae bacterium]